MLFCDPQNREGKLLTESRQILVCQRKPFLNVLLKWKKEIINYCGGGKKGGANC